MFDGRTIKGSSFGGYKGRSSIPQLIDLYLNNKIFVDEFVTGVITLDNINEGFDTMVKGNGLRTIVKY